MFGTVRVGGWKLTVFSMLCFVIFLAICLIMLRSGAPDTVTVGGSSYSLSVTDDSDIAAFIAGCGYEPGECVSDSEITVPKTWNPAYEAYAAMQEEQGFRLTPYKGMTARQVIYAVENGEYAEILICGGRIIAAHLSTMRYGDTPRPLIK